MGLTINHKITAPKKWDWQDVVNKLKAVQAFAGTLPVMQVNEIKSFEGNETDFNSSEDEDRTFLIASQRYLQSPWKPGEHHSQNPSKTVGFDIYVAPGCEPLEIGLAEYPEYVFEPYDLTFVQGQSFSRIVNWDYVLNQKNPNKITRQSVKIIRAFMKKWGLKKSPNNRRWDNYINRPEYIKYFHRVHMNDADGEKIPSVILARVGLARGRYLSHRKGHDKSIAVIEFAHRHHFEKGLILEFKDADSASKVAKSKEFQDELLDMVRGKRDTVPPIRQFNSFTKTQYASNPACGGIPNFLNAHISIIKIFDRMKELGFEVKVNDEGEYYEKRDIEALIKEVGEWNCMVAGMAGALKDAIGDDNELESPIFSFSDFEHIEAKANVDIEFLEKMKSVAEVVRASVAAQSPENTE